MHIPSLSTEQMIEVDRLMVEEYGIQLIQMMENAGKNLAELSRRMLGGSVRSKRVAVLCGTGNNGGGGMVAARHLHNWGAQVLVNIIGNQARIKDVPALQLAIIKAMGMQEYDRIDLDTVDLIIDAMIGYGLSGDPRGNVAEWIESANRSGQPILALDTPSGLNTTTGVPGNPCIRASATMTLALPKRGLIAVQARPFIGALYLADISVPPQLYSRLGVEVPDLFSNEAIVELVP